MTGHASRATVDFDAFERELRQTSQEAVRAKAPEPTAPKGDPLAELARIVGQDDPFRALLEAREKGGAGMARQEISQETRQEIRHEAPAASHETRTAETGRPARIEPTFVDAPAHDAAQSPADAFDQYLASVEQGMYADGPADPAAFAEADESYRTGPVERPRSRNRLVQVGAGLAVVAVCVGGALAWRGTHGVGGGGPITVLADKTPLKVQPTATDGVEIPDQNKQIYDRNAKDGQIRIVNREEQPLDVNQAARTAAAHSEGGDPGQGGATPGQGGGPLTDTFGEPRRVRTVSVKPDAPLLQAPQAQPQASQPQPQAEPVQASTSPIPTMTMPESSGPSTATPSAEPRRAPSRTLATSAASAPVAEAPQPVAAPAPKASQRVAAVSPETTASTSDPAASSASLTAPVGGYSVQLGVRGSESEARSAFREMQGKYSQLAGKPELIRQAEVNGKTLYRVRVGPLAKAEASSLCSTLQGAGGQCFVAKN